ncbi:MAG: SDR family oxidoreductase [Actinomycetota bacterium]|jgi:NAD(P)-dependent dehydrogenase (short-subunit alcohol dehydrogenase family)|nr:SDR family oxidoreductase [Actinomycetota bacterium]
MSKRILLTGGSTGIGNATLQRLAADGHEVVNLDVKDAPEGAAEHHHCDLSDPASIDAVVAGLGGSFDGLGNIAGVAGSMGSELVLRVNVYGLRHVTDALLGAGKLSDGGSIVNIASLAGMAWQRHLDRIAELDAAADYTAGIEVAKAYDRGGPNAYVLSKEWVVSYTKHLAGQLVGKGIRVNSVSPGPVDTPLFPYFETDAGAEQMAWMNEQVGRVGTPDDEAQAVAWLLAGDSGWVNGVDLPVDGGLSAGMAVGWADTKQSPASVARRQG